MHDFKCNSCSRKFTDEGKMVEYSDPVFGACARRIATCPECGAQASEYIKPRPVKVTTKKMPACGNDNCCCMN